MARAGGPKFELLNDDEMAELLHDSDASSTRKTIKFGISKLEYFCKLKKVNLHDISANLDKENTAELDTLLTSFYASVRKEDGSLYHKKSMQYIRYGVQRHFLDNFGVDISNKDRFPQSMRMYKAVLVKLKKEGLGVVKHKDAISEADMHKMQTSRFLDTNTPSGLQNKVFIDVMMYFCNRGRENVREFKPADFTISSDEDRLRYVTKRDNLTKNHRENDEEAGGGRMYEVRGANDNQCPVKTYEKYVSKLNPSCPWFWQTPKPKTPTNESDPWYQNVPVGINTLNNKLKTISKGAECTKIYTNHCLRSTCITTLDRAGFETRDIMSVSGHRSETSIKTYTKTSDVRKKEMSEKLSKQLYHAHAAEAKPSHHEGESGIVGQGNLPLSPSCKLPTTSTMPATLALAQPVPLPVVHVPPPPTRTPLAEMQQLQSLSLLLSESNSSSTSTTSHNFNIHDCVVHIHN